jgi:hypothetical protein
MFLDECCFSCGVSVEESYIHLFHIKCINTNITDNES